MTENPWKNFISGITDPEFYQIIQNYNKFEEDGCIGDCFLRSKAEEWLEQTGLSSSYVTFIMRELAFAAFRRFANIHLDE
jgi:hypothetical protein